MAHHTNSGFFFGMLIPVFLVVAAVRVALEGTSGVLTLETALYTVGITIVATIIEARMRRVPKKKRLDER